MINNRFHPWQQAPPQLRSNGALSGVNVATAFGGLIARVQNAFHKDFQELLTAISKALGRKYGPVVLDVDEFGFEDFLESFERWLRQNHDENAGWIMYPVQLDLNPDFLVPDDNSFWGGPQRSIGEIEPTIPPGIRYTVDDYQYQPDGESNSPTFQFNAELQFGNGESKWRFKAKAGFINYDITRAADRGFFNGFIEVPETQFDLGQSMVDEIDFWENMNWTSGPGGIDRHSFDSGGGGPDFLGPDPEPPTPPPDSSGGNGTEPPTGSDPSGGGGGGGGNGGGGNGGGGGEPPDPGSGIESHPEPPLGGGNSIMVWPPWGAGLLNQLAKGLTDLKIAYQVSNAGLLRTAQLGAGQKFTQRIL